MANTTNADLLIEIEISKQSDQITETLGKMIVWIADHLTTNSNYDHITYKGNLHEAAVKGMVLRYKEFNPEHSDNPFAFLMQVARCAIKHALIYDIKE